MGDKYLSFMYKSSDNFFCVTATVESRQFWREWLVQYYVAKRINTFYMKLDSKHSKILYPELSITFENFYVLFCSG